MDKLTINRIIVLAFTYAIILLVIPHILIKIVALTIIIFVMVIALIKWFQFWVEMRKYDKIADD